MDASSVPSFRCMLILLPWPGSIALLPGEPMRRMWRPCPLALIWLSTNVLCRHMIVLLLRWLLMTRERPRKELWARSTTGGRSPWRRHSPTRVPSLVAGGRLAPRRFSEAERNIAASNEQLSTLRQALAVGLTATCALPTSP